MSERVVVTGGAGRLGKMVVDDLLSHERAVLSVDCVRPESSPCEFLPVDLTNPAEVFDALAGADAVIHLGAVPGPRVRAPSTTFANNVLSTYNVAEAAAALGLKKMVFASTVFTLGWHRDPRRVRPCYVPVDEDHPLAPLEPYGLSKLVGEEICASVTRRTGMPTVSLRIMNVIQFDGYASLPWPTPTREQPVQFVMWPYVDVRDAATACRLALDAKAIGHEAFYIAGSDIRFDASTEQLLAEFFPDVEIRGPLPGKTSVISTAKAEAMLGYQPHYSWQTEVSGNAAGS